MVCGKMKPWGNPFFFICGFPLSFSTPSLSFPRPWAVPDHLCLEETIHLLESQRQAKTLTACLDFSKEWFSGTNKDQVRQASNISYGDGLARTKNKTFGKLSFGQKYRQAELVFPKGFYSFPRKTRSRMAMGKLERRIQKLMKATLGRLDSS